MTKERRADFQVGSAVGMLAAGVALSVAGFLAPPLGEISDSVLWFFAQCLLYAGSIFGVSAYVQAKLWELGAGRGGGQAAARGPLPERKEGV